MPEAEVITLTKEVNEMKLSINDLENQVENLANTVAALTEQLRLRAVQDAADAAGRIARAQAWAVMQAEHNACKERREKETAWLSGRFGAIVDKVLPVIIGAAFMYLYARGGVK